MKTSVEIDKDLLEDAKRILGTDTIRETLEKSLHAVVRQRELKEVVDLFGTIDMDLTLEKLRQMRHKRTRNAPR